MCTRPRVCTTTSTCARSTDSAVKARGCCTSSMLAPSAPSSCATPASAPGMSCTSKQRRASRPGFTMPRSMVSANTSGSMLPPHGIRPTFRPPNLSPCFINAARPTAPALSITVFSMSSNTNTACSMSSSPTSTTSSTHRSINGKVKAPGDSTAMPSAHGLQWPPPRSTHRRRSPPEACRWRAAAPASPARSCPAGHHRQAVGVDEPEAAQLRELQAVAARVVERIAFENDWRREPARAVDLDRRRKPRHHDRRRDAQALCVMGHALRMVAGRNHTHTARTPQAHRKHARRGSTEPARSTRHAL